MHSENCIPFVTFWVLRQKFIKLCQKRWKMPKLKNSNETFWMIFKQCEVRLKRLECNTRISTSVIDVIILSIVFFRAFIWWHWFSLRGFGGLCRCHWLISLRGSAVQRHCVLALPENAEAEGHGGLGGQPQCKRACPTSTKHNFHSWFGGQLHCQPWYSQVANDQIRIRAFNASQNTLRCT